MKKIFMITFLMFSLFGGFRIKARDSYYELIDYQINGKDILHYNSTEKIKIPNRYFETKFQSRAVWVSTVYNIDFPKMRDEEDFKENFNILLDDVESFNLNTIYFQVRPMLDAFYPSVYNPWSVYLTGIQGKDPGFDPLEYMIEETHSRGIAFHAWLNPYRITKAFTGTVDSFIKTLHEDNFARKNPETILHSGKDAILNPAEPKVIQHILDTVEELCKYDIDGINFDDYFYFNQMSTSIDYNSYTNYLNINPLNHPEGLDFASFRRENVNYLIKNINLLLNKINEKNNTNIKFGISPAGVWASKKTHPEGANVSGGYECYRDLYADIRKWVKEDWIDYVSPQIYYTFNSGNCYADLIDWWAETVEGTDCMLNVSNGIYRFDDETWFYKNEVRDQMTYNLKHKNVTGITFFSLKTLRYPQKDITKEVVANLRTLMTKKVLPPIQKTNIKKDVTVEEVAIHQKQNNSVLRVKEAENAYGYVLYKKLKNAEFDFENPDNFVLSFRANKNKEYSATTTEYLETDKYDYALRAVSQDGEEKTEVYNISTIKQNSAPSQVKINIGDNTKTVFEPAEEVLITFNPATDLEGEKLTYELRFSQSGDNFRFKYTPVLVNGVYQFKFKMFYNETDDAMFKVIVSDGEAISESFSQKISVKDSSTNPPVTTTTTESPTESETTTTDSNNDSKNGCKVNKFNLNSVFVQLISGISLISIAVYLIKRK